MRVPANVKTALRWGLTAAVLLFVAVAIRRQWTPLSNEFANIHIRWSFVAAASCLVLATYTLLIETWRRVLYVQGARLGFRPAMRIWFVSNLGKYIPGKIWSVTTMMAMAREAGVPVAVAGSAAVIVQVSSLLGGMVILITAGSQVVSPWMAAAGIATLLAVPYLLPHITRILGREPLHVPLRAIFIALTGSMVAWLMYGIAFKMLALSIGIREGPLEAYITVYIASYTVGFLAVFVPGGIGVREGTLMALMPAAHLATVAEAILLAAVSRLWLTILEIVPGLIALVLGRRAKTRR